MRPGIAVTLLVPALIGHTGCAMLFSYTPEIPIEEPGAPAPTAFMRRVPVGDGEQWITVRGADTSKPLLFYLHGGPGSPVTPLFRQFCPEIESHFVMVYWEQRGAGKSFSQASAESMTLSQFVSDAAEVIRWTLDHFDRDRAIVLGHSWGSFVGIALARRHPELLHAYVGVGQMVARRESERLSYEYVLGRARRDGDEEAVRELEEIGPPPWPPDDWVGSLRVERKFVRRYGGMVVDRDRLRELTSAWRLLQWEEYNLWDKVNWVRGQLRSERLVMAETLRADFRETAARLDVPVFFLQGVHDRQTVTSLVEDYYDELEAPHKELHLFEHSAHVVFAEEPERFVQILVERVAPWTESEGEIR